MLSSIILEPHFGVVDPAVGHLTLKFKLGLDFLIMHQPIKFCHPVFNRSEFIVLTNQHTNALTNKEILLKTSISLRYTTPVEKHDSVDDATHDFSQSQLTGLHAMIQYNYYIHLTAFFPGQPG